MMQMLFMLLLVVGAMAQSDAGERRKICTREMWHARMLYCNHMEPAPEDAEETTFKTAVYGMPEIVSPNPNSHARFTYKVRRAAEKALDSTLVEACCLDPFHINDALKKC